MQAECNCIGSVRIVFEELVKDIRQLQVFGVDTKQHLQRCHQKHWMPKRRTPNGITFT
jgi:hypothetical protein